MRRRLNSTLFSPSLEGTIEKQDGGFRLTHIVLAPVTISKGEEGERIGRFGGECGAHLSCFAILGGVRLRSSRRSLSGRTCTPRSSTFPFEPSFHRTIV